MCAYNMLANPANKNLLHLFDCFDEFLKDSRTIHPQLLALVALKMSAIQSNNSRPGSCCHFLSPFWDPNVESEHESCVDYLCSARWVFRILGPNCVATHRKRNPAIRDPYKFAFFDWNYRTLFQNFRTCLGFEKTSKVVQRNAAANNFADVDELETDALGLSPREHPQSRIWPCLGAAAKRPFLQRQHSRRGSRVSHNCLKLRDLRKI